MNYRIYLRTGEYAETSAQDRFEALKDFKLLDDRGLWIEEYTESPGELQRWLRMKYKPAYHHLWIDHYHEDEGLVSLYNPRDHCWYAVTPQQEWKQKRFRAIAFNRMRIGEPFDIPCISGPCNNFGSFGMMMLDPPEALCWYHWTYVHKHTKEVFRKRHLKYWRTAHTKMAEVPRRLHRDWEDCKREACRFD